MKFYIFPEKGEPVSRKVHIKEVLKYLYVIKELNWGPHIAGIYLGEVKIADNPISSLGLRELLDNLDESQSSKLMELNSFIENQHPEFARLDIADRSICQYLWAIALKNNAQVNVPITERKIETMETTSTKSKFFAKNGKNVTNATRAQNLIDRANSTMANIKDCGELNKKAKLGQCISLMNLWVAMHRLHNVKGVEDATVTNLRQAMKSIRQLISEPSVSIDKFTMKQMASYGEAQMLRNDAKKSQQTSWEKATSMIVGGTKSKLHKIWAVTAITAHYVWEWTWNKCIPALKQSAIQVWDWCRNLFKGSPKVEVTTGTPPIGADNQGDAIIALA